MSEMGGVEVATCDPNTIILTHLVGDLEIPCDWDRIFKCGPRAAQWVAAVRCGCGYSSHRLICEGCKTVALATEEGLMCPNICGEVAVPARRAIAYIEPLGKM